MTDKQNVDETMNVLGKRISVHVENLKKLKEQILDLEFQYNTELSLIKNFTKLSEETANNYGSFDMDCHNQEYKKYIADKVIMDIEGEKK